MQNAKIVCTLGPASEDRGTIEELVAAGMRVARLNASHGSPSQRATIYERLRAVDADGPTPLASMLDLAGPEVRTAPIEGTVTIDAGSTVRFAQGEEANPGTVGVSVPLTGVSVGDRILIDEGRIETTVEGIEGATVIASVDVGGELAGRRSVHIPGVDLPLETVTEADREDLRVAVEHDVDLVAASFVRNAGDVLAVSETLEAFGGSIPVIAKIERAAAVENLAGIIEAAAGVMVARGDLGVECPMEDVPMIQKRIIRRCHEQGVPVITATEMLDSMIHERRPTRAEASDVANAVLDGTDAVMLSAETAVGDHPRLVVEAMARIIQEVEGSEEYREVREQRVPAAARGSRTEALARSARFLARDVGASAVVVVTESGYTARRTAKFRPPVPVVAATPSPSVRRRLTLSWGIVPELVPFAERRVDAVIEDAVGAAIDAGVVDSGETVVVLSGVMTGLERASTTNMLKVHVAAEVLATGTAVVGGLASGPLEWCPDGSLEDVPPGALVALPASFDAEFVGDLERIAGIVDARGGLTGYPAMVARERGIPMVSGVDLEGLEPGSVVTLDGERGVIYEGEIVETEDEDEGEEVA